MSEQKIHAMFTDDKAAAVCGFLAAFVKAVYNVTDGTDLITLHSIIHFYELDISLYFQTFFLHVFEAGVMGLIGAAFAVVGKHLGTKFKNRFLK